MEGRPIWALRVGAPLERWIYRLCGVDPAREMGWKRYAVGLLLFNALGRARALCPAAPAALAAAESAAASRTSSPDSSFNTAVSFITNTNWQGYSGESTMSYLTQMAGLAVQNFLSAATGIVVAVALIRGFARHSAKVDRQLLGRPDPRDALRPAAARRSLLAIVLVGQGVVQNFSAYKDVTTRRDAHLPAAEDRCRGQSAEGRGRQSRAWRRLDAPRRRPCRWARSPRRRAIKELGTNGGGFINANSAHPYENPTPLSNFLEMLAILLIPGGADLHLRHGWLATRARAGRCFAAMLILFVPLLCDRGAQRAGRQSAHRRARRRPDAPALMQPGGNMEGKEARFGIAASALFATVTTGDLLRRGQLHARLVHPARRLRAALQHAARRGGVRRRRHGSVLDADLRDHRRLHRRPDDRTHARVSRQEDRGVRDEDELDRDPRHALHRAGRHRRRGQRGGRARRASRIPARTASPRSSTRSPPPATTTAARSRASPPTRRSTTRRSAS